MTEQAISATEAAVLFMGLLERNEWRFSLTAAGALHAVIGDDCPPRWQQAKILAVLAAMEPAIVALLAERGLDGIGDGGAIH